MLRDQLAWYVGGPVFGLCVVACRALFGARLGVTGGFSEIISKLGARSLRFDWRGWFLIGVLAGGVAFALLNGGPSFHGFGWFTRTFDGEAGTAAIAGILAVGGVLIGYGAKTMGGCTSGNGLSGTASLSPAALVATATFFATAIVVAFVVRALT